MALLTARGGALTARGGAGEIGWEGQGGGSDGASTGGAPSNPNLAA